MYTYTPTLLVLHLVVLHFVGFYRWPTTLFIFLGGKLSLAKDKIIIMITVINVQNCAIFKPKFTVFFSLQHVLKINHRSFLEKSSAF